MKIMVFSPTPLELFRSSWLPVCDQSTYGYCHRVKEGEELQGDCSFAPAYKKAACRQVILEFKEG